MNHKNDDLNNIKKYHAMNELINLSEISLAKKWSEVNSIAMYLVTFKPSSLSNLNPVQNLPSLVIPDHLDLN